MTLIWPLWPAGKMVDCPHLEDCARIRRLVRPGGGGGGSSSKVEGNGNETLGKSTSSSVPNEETSPEISDGVKEHQEMQQQQQQQKPGNCDEGDDSWRCQTCRTEQSPWICIFCGSIGCGRYVNAHAKSHFEGQYLDCDGYDRIDSCAVFTH